jgi:N-methylhydantoinase A/oxoprolinase/acetone carboxylase beta subunit
MTAKNYRGHDLAPDHNIHGPAFVDGDNTTLVLPPESELTITDHGNYHITL